MKIRGFKKNKELAALVERELKRLFCVDLRLPDGCLVSFGVVIRPKPNVLDGCPVSVRR